jgi:S1-C subfamily serine protease
LGVSVRSLDSEFVKKEDLSVNEGAYVSDFGNMEDKSAAKEAGIKAGDVVVKLDEMQIKTSTALIEYIGRKRPGDKISVTVNRHGKEIVIPVTLKNREGKLGTVKREEKDAVTSLGIELEDVDAKTLKGLDLANGVRVKSLSHGKVEKYTDMRTGFIITHIDNVPVKSAKEVNEILKKKQPGDKLIFEGVYPDFPREYLYAMKF